jgi:hypothetical protein
VSAPGIGRILRRTVRRPNEGRVGRGPDQGGKGAAGAEGIGGGAEIGDDLEEALLEGGIAWDGPAGGAEQAFAGLAEGGIVLASGPVEVGVFHPGEHGWIGAQACPSPEPGQDHVDGEIGDAGQAEQGPRGGGIPRVEIPVVIPEGVGTGLEYGCGSEEEFVALGGAEQDFDQAGGEQGL